MSIELPAVAISHDGRRAVALMEIVQQQASVFHDRIVGVRIRVSPESEMQYTTIAIPSWHSGEYEVQELGLPADDEAIAYHLTLFGLGECLDDGDLELASGGQRRTPQLAPSYTQLYAYARSRRHSRQPDLQVATPEQGFTYVGAKINWCFEYGYERAPFTVVDDARLGRPPGDLMRISRREEGRYWQRADDQHLIGMPRLFDAVQAGAFPGLYRSPIVAVQEKLGADRYKAANQAWQKALTFLFGDDPDPANAVKEAISAVESVSLVAAGMRKGTMGEAIKSLRTQDKIRPPLDRIFHTLWGVSNQDSGVRHRSPEVSRTTPAEASFLVNNCASALLLLLEIDVVE